MPMGRKTELRSKLVSSPGISVWTVGILAVMPNALLEKTLPWSKLQAAAAQSSLWFLCLSFGRVWHSLAVVVVLFSAKEHLLIDSVICGPYKTINLKISLLQAG